VFNRCLAERIESYKETGKAPTRFEQDKGLTTLKKELSWLREVDATSLQASVQDLNSAYLNFYRRVKQGGPPGFPKFKSKRSQKIAAANTLWLSAAPTLISSRYQKPAKWSA
jgi:putative transposase